MKAPNIYHYFRMYCIVAVAALMFSFSANGATYYVAVNGNNSNQGTSPESPFQTIVKAISVVQPGDSIIVRGGVHPYSTTISIAKSGTESDSLYLLAYPGERPVLDFSMQNFGSRGISLTGNYWMIKGFDIRSSGDNGLQISVGGNNTIEFCLFYENKDSGVQLSNGAHDNTFINCDSYYNADPPDYGDADGFAPKLNVGSNNRFVACRAWGNCDDGWDGYMRGATNVTTILENCWTWGNGYLKDGTDPGSQANGNGFKMGGGDNGNSENLMHHFRLSNCVAFKNKVKGFDQNNNVGSMLLLNCSAFENLTANYRIKKELVSGQSLIVKNCISLNGLVDLGDFAIQATNSWMDPFTISEADFVSVDTTGVSAPRKEDGSLPDVAFMHLIEGSSLIDAGTDVGLPFAGTAPDLGAFEFGLATGFLIAPLSETKFWLKGNDLHFSTNSSDKNSILELYSMNGNLVFRKEIADGIQTVKCPVLKPGIYLVALKTSQKRFVQKLVKQ